MSKTYSMSVCMSKTTFLGKRFQYIKGYFQGENGSVKGLQENKKGLEARARVQVTGEGHQTLMIDLNLFSYFVVMKLLVLYNIIPYPTKLCSGEVTVLSYLMWCTKLELLNIPWNRYTHTNSCPSASNPSKAIDILLAKQPY